MPLSNILGLAELLHVGEYGTLSPEQKDILDRVMRSCQDLLSLINDVLDMSRIEAGKLELHLEDVDITAQVDAVVARLGPLIKERGNTLTVRYPTGLGMMRTDTTRLRQML